ncbi:MAG: diacylglycerol kinase family lipid kinase [Alphaproteobacteria bacterium]|nr:diacylglycerol kinase family lipid kinase [Alphaproteobacteria bacterium]
MAVQRIFVLINPGSGAFLQTPETALRFNLERAFAKHGLAVTAVFASSENLRVAAESALAQFRQEKIDAIVIGGGDGSIRIVAGVLAETNAPLGVIPLGTRNHFAKDLGIPLSVDAAVGTIASGHTRVVDIAEVNGETFVNTSSIGIYPYMVIDRERRRTTYKLTKWMAMTLAFLRVLHNFPRQRLRLRAEGLARPYHTPCLFVGNNEYGIDLFTLGHRPRLDSGALWFYVLKPSNAWELFLTVCRLCLRHPNPERDLDTFKLKEAEIDAKTSRLPVALDGDVQMLHPPLHYRSRPGALRVITPVAK